ncbi:hypothetical protein TraAM80_00822 [Trypanosoma rangeli]|uniref:Uncharacterized protein n=1 Tax=Trypanosoma rangeli TaxID=5698 RepID=A0A422P1P0_TRYRA|nr:uncharacterized protein TraAM80_00822 [Trypanosoma rangeli]RNF11628.1 hypothetical protein TraAM80_00822 [Trypanosoma rangeli]|eukprot:RNF11628.1 hypothetical protein TraAM80_00822 [Trypanosoma rangeli]
MQNYLDVRIWGRIVRLRGRILRIRNQTPLRIVLVMDTADAHTGRRYSQVAGLSALSCVMGRYIVWGESGPKLFDRDAASEGPRLIVSVSWKEDEKGVCFLSLIDVL